LKPDLLLTQNLCSVCSITEEEVGIIRAADPLEVRRLEALAGPESAEKFAAIYERERQALHAAWPRRRH
jgi:glutaconate CoA-transferase subunit B